MLDAKAIAKMGLLPDSIVHDTLLRGLGGRFTGQRVLVLVPDHTRTMPLGLIFRALVAALHDAQQVDVMVALGTHPPLSDAELCALLGITPDERATTYRHIGLHNHAWDQPDALATIGTITQAEVQDIAGTAWHPSLGGDVPVRINRAALDADQIIIAGPTFPHEVAGFSGGAKYLFPGISGPAMINVTHWLGALITNRATIGVVDTPMRALIHHAAALVPTPATLASVVVAEKKGRVGLKGVFVGRVDEAFYAAADLAAQHHIVRIAQPFRQVLAHAPAMYDELWTAAKAMYKLEPAVADGGEIILFAPHLDTISRAHDTHLMRIGYHVRDYFLQQWDRFADVPLGVLAHSTHLKGSGTYANGVEQPRIRVTLASRIPRETCEALNLGYRDPDTINPADWQHREAEGLLYVAKAGEDLYRVVPGS